MHTLPLAYHQPQSPPASPPASPHTAPSFDAQGGRGEHKRSGERERDRERRRRRRRMAVGEMLVQQIDVLDVNVSLISLADRRPSAPSDP
eukprot:5833093-Prymnesium_polylepis.1